MIPEKSEIYSKLINSIELKDIVNLQTQFSRAASYGIVQKKKKFKIEISRASFKPEYILNGKTLIVPVAFHLEIKSDEEGIATLEFQYEVFFSVKEVKDFKDVIKDNDILEFFIGYQMDKFVWSYLRCHFSEACVRMGISKVILPMMQ